MWKFPGGGLLNMIFKKIYSFIEGRLYLIALFGFVVSLFALLSGNSSIFLRLPFLSLTLFILFVFLGKQRLEQSEKNSSQKADKKGGDGDVGDHPPTFQEEEPYKFDEEEKVILGKTYDEDIHTKEEVMQHAIKN